MCVRRKKRNLSKDKSSKKTQTKLRKRKRNCCTRCCVAISGWCFKRFSRCIKKKIFGIPDPRWSDYEIAGVGIENLKEQFTRKDLSPRKGSTVVTLYKNNNEFSKTNISLKNLDLIEGLEADDLKKKYSIKGSKGKLLDHLVDDYKKGYLSSSAVSFKSKLSVRKLDVNKLNELLESYAQKKSNKSKSLKDVNFENIRKSLSRKGSKKKLFNKYFKKGKVSKTALSKIHQEYKNKESISDRIQDLKNNQNKKMSFTNSSKFKDLNNFSQLKNVLSSVRRK